ncbi:DUF6249 domain-containing protein [Frateuria aurantia]
MSDPMNSLTGLMAVVLSLSMPVVMLLIILKYRARGEERRQALYLEALRQGKSIDLAALQPDGQRRWANFRTGIVLAMLGLGLLVCGMIENERDWMAAACLPMFTGLGFLITFWMQSRAQRAAAARTAAVHDA